MTLFQSLHRGHRFFLKRLDEPLITNDAHTSTHPKFTILHKFTPYYTLLRLHRHLRFKNLRLDRNIRRILPFMIKQKFTLPGVHHFADTRGVH